MYQTHGFLLLLFIVFVNDHLLATQHFQEKTILSEETLSLMFVLAIFYNDKYFH